MLKLKIVAGSIRLRILKAAGLGVYLIDSGCGKKGKGQKDDC
jgi:hypothetical protein